MKILLSLFFLFTLFLSKAQSTLVMTYNIRYANPGDNEDRWEKRKGKVVDLIVNYQPDIFGIQEGLSHQVHYLDSLLPQYLYVGVGRDDGKQKGEYCALFYDTTRYAVLQTGTFWLSPTPKTISVGWDAALERICTFGLFEDQLAGTKLWVFNTHFDHKGKVARERSARLIVNQIKKLIIDHLAPIVLMGDLNSLPDDVPIHKLSEWLTDASKISTHKVYGPAGTFNGFDNTATMSRRIDYIFVRGLKVVRYLHIDDRRNNNHFPSDHLPVLAEVK